MHIATSVSSFSIRIVNLADVNQTLRTINGLQSRAQNCSGRFTQGCEWDVTAVVDVPTNWRSGYYAAVFPTSFGERYVPFVVRENIPASTSSIAVLASTHTWQAYNEFGGRSTYPNTSPSRAVRITYDRPYHGENGLGRYEAFDRHFVDWMTSEGRAFEAITDVDLEDPTALSGYRVLVIPGHSEYWTASARNHVQQFIANGGHVALLNGNSMWWQIRLEEQNRVIAAYKGADYDPALEAGSPLAATHFFSHPVNNPENRLIGTSFRNGGYANRLNDQTNEMKPIAERTPWTVTNGDHWIYNGTGLRDGDPFGRDTVGLEVDGAVFNCDTFGRVIGPEGSDETPLHYQILAITPASDGWGTLGLLVHSSGGAVFNAATNGWVWGLATSDTVRRITSNVLDRFSTGAPLPYQPVESRIFAQDLFNCPQSSIRAAGWESGPQQVRPQVTAGCAYEGPGGLELAGEAQIAIARSLAPADQFRTEAHIRMYLKADELRQRTAFPMAIVGLEERTASTAKRAAFIELDATSGKRIRIARRSPSGAFFASDWVPLADGWRRIDVTWRSPGTMTLQVDGGTPVALENPDAGQRINRVVIAYPQPELTNEGRVCIDAFAIGAENPGPVAALK